MTAHDPRVTLTEVLAAHRPKHRSVEGPNTTCTGCDWTTYVPFGSSSFAAHSLHLAEVIESEVIAARLAPIRALADDWEAAGFEIEPAQLREALDAPVSASQGHDGEVEVMGADFPDAYLYVASGQHLVLLCDHDAPRWRNGVCLTPYNARKLAAALVRMADQSEEPDDDDK